ncbi:hypothetical protein AAHB59_20105 [Bacillus cereus]
MKTRYFIGAILGYKFAAKFAISGTKNMHKASTEIPARKIITFKNVVELRLRFIYNTSLI